MIPAGEAILRLFRTIGVPTLLAAACVASVMHRAHAQGDDRPTLVGKFGDWGAYAGTRGGHKVCFAMAQPTSSQTNPPNRPRDPIYLFISTRPADNVRNEVSVILGYPLKSGSEATADIGSMHFVLQTRVDNAWVKDAADEARMVDAMRRGSDVVIAGVSGRGTQTTDRYSLKGIAQALDRAAQDCR
jgi:invasion protein IalB